MDTPDHTRILSRLAYSKKNGRMGVVVRVFPKKGYGFLVHKAALAIEEVFFHCTGLADIEIEDLYPGKRVGFQFARRRDSRGPKARLVWVEAGDDNKLYDAWVMRVAQEERGMKG